MPLGTWAEWFGAVATAAATVVALYLGARNGELVAERARARTVIRNLAAADARVFDRLEVGLSLNELRHDGPGELDDDEQVARYAEAAFALGWLRRRIAVALLRYIYGEGHLWLARIDPLHQPGDSMRRLLTAIAIVSETLPPDFRSGTRLHRALLEDAPRGLRRSVRRAFRVLAHI